jgi:hypothetical protein
MQHATPRCNRPPLKQVRTPCNMKHPCTVPSTSCSMHHTLQRTRCNPMQHAQLPAMRTAHRRRACDAAALELDRPSIHHHRATILQTAAPSASDRIGLRSRAYHSFGIVDRHRLESNGPTPHIQHAAVLHSSRNALRGALSPAGCYASHGRLGCVVLSAPIEIASARPPH